MQINARIVLSEDTTPRAVLNDIGIVFMLIPIWIVQPQIRCQVSLYEMD